MVTVEKVRRRELDRLATAARNGVRGQVVQANPGQGKTQLALDFAKLTDAVFVQASGGLDRSTQLVLSVAEALGTSEPAAILAARNDNIVDALKGLERALGGRSLVVDDVDKFERPSIQDHEIGVLAHEAVEPTLDWLSRHASLMTARSWRNAQRLDRIRPTTKRILTDALRHLEGRTSPQPVLRPLLEQVYGACPDQAQRALTLVASHEGPLDREIVERHSSAWACKLLVETKLLREWNGRLLAGRKWNLWLALTQPQGLLRAHQELAKDFSVRVAERDHRTAINMVHAHRHYLAAGDVLAAAHLARYSILPLLDAARSLSIRKEWDRAADLYGMVCQHPASAIGARAAGYAKHYYHYNLAKSQREPLVATVRGYSEALDLWPENALFWSRLALAQFHQHQGAEAERTLDRARASVPQHPEKETTLRSRTVKKLVARGAVVDALRVWGDYQALNQKDREAHVALLAAAERGWRASTLSAAGVPLTVLRREVQLRLSKIGADYRVEIPELDVGARAPTPAIAFEKAVRNLREEVKRLIRALSHTLSAADRLRKGTLLGLVDPVASRLLEGVSAPVWALGKLVQDGDRLWLEVHEDQRYEVPPSLRVPADGRLWLAQMTAGDAGQPVAPLLTLEAIGSDQPEEVLEAWSKRVHGSA
jgi:hypothetical protein